MKISNFKEIFPNGWVKFELNKSSVIVEVSEGAGGFVCRNFVTINSKEEIASAKEKVLAEVFEMVGYPVESTTKEEFKPIVAVANSKAKDENASPVKKRTEESVPVKQLAFDITPPETKAVEAEDTEHSAEKTANVSVESTDTKTVSTPISEIARPAVEEKKPIDTASANLSKFAKMTTEEKIETAARYVLPFGRHKGKLLGEVFTLAASTGNWEFVNFLRLTCTRLDVREYARTLYNEYTKKASA